MSHILDALRKAQDESTGTSRTSVTGSEALIARRSGGRWGGMTQRVWIMAGSGVVLLAVVGWILYGPSEKSSGRQAVVQSAPSPQPSVAPPAAPALAPALPQQPSLPSPQPTPAVVSAVPSQAPVPKQADESEEESESRNRRNRRSPQGANKAAGAVSPLSAPAPAASVPAAPAVPAVPAAAPPPGAPVVAGTPEGVKLTGIAWQENRKLRRAVVNDVLVGEGVLVAGAKVVEIRPTAVRFEKNGSIFEVVLPR